MKYVIWALAIGLILSPLLIHAQSIVAINAPSQPVPLEKPTLLFSMTANPQAIQLPSIVTVSMQLTNTGSVAATAVTISDTLPVGWSYASPDYPKKFSTLGTLPAGETISLVVPMELSPATPLDRVVYEAIASASNADPILALAAVEVSAAGPEPVGKVLGASTTLAESGNDPISLWLMGIVLLVFGLRLTRRVN